MRSTLPVDDSIRSRYPQLHPTIPDRSRCHRSQPSGQIKPSILRRATLTVNASIRRASVIRDGFVRCNAGDGEVRGRRTGHSYGTVTLGECRKCERRRQPTKATDHGGALWEEVKARLTANSAPHQRRRSTAVRLRSDKWSEFKWDRQRSRDGHVNFNRAS